MSPSKDDPTPAKTGTKFQIKGFNLSQKNGAQPKNHLGKRSRGGGFGGRGEDEDGEEGRKGEEIVTGFEGGRGVRGGDDVREERKELVIKGLRNRDWKSEARSRRGGGAGKGRNLLPAEVQAARSGRAGGGKKEEGVDVVNSNDGEIQWGLSVRKRVKGEDTQAADTNEVEIPREVRKQTADEEAIAALMGEKPKKKGEDLVIPITSTEHQDHEQENGYGHEHISEADAYKRAIALAPDSSTLEDYERIPVEEFGAALLRGMGWKGKNVGKVKDVKRRGNLLGLGAKEGNVKEAEELGAWVNRSDSKMLRNGGRGGGERRIKAGEYKREEERRREDRERRGGGGYRDRDRDERGYRDSGSDRRR